MVVTGSALLSLALMISQAMESVTRAFYSRSDLDLILASPVAARKVFAVRIATMALSVTMMAMLLAAPFINVLAFEGGARWLGAYGVVAAMGAAATAFAVALTVALFRSIGPKRTRLVAQIVAAVIGAAFVIGLQVAAILSYGTHVAHRFPEVGRGARARARCRQHRVVAGARDPRRPAGARDRARRKPRAARRRHRGVLGAVRRPRHRGGGRRRHARAPGPLVERVPPRLAQGRAAAARNGRCCAATRGWCRRR